MADDLLFIDRDEKLTAALSVYLARQQFEVTCVHSWKRASAYLEGDFSGIILVDPDLPDADEKGIFRSLKTNCCTRPVIVAAGPEMLEIAMEYLRADATEYLVKPIKSLELDIALKHCRDKLALNRKVDHYTQKLEDLHTTQVLYQQLFDEVPCYISVQDSQFRLTATNRMFKNDFGHQIGGYCYQIYKHRTTPCPKCPVAKTFEDGRHHQTEEVVTSRSGKQYNVLTWTAPIINDQGDITQVMEMATNITQIRRLQDHLTSLGLMLGSMSHGVKGMLTALDGGVYQLETGLQKNDQKRVELGFDRIQGTVERIRKMVLEILFYAKSRGIAYETTSVKMLAEAVVGAIQSAIDKHDIELKVNVVPDAGDFQVDPNWFQQSLINFLENAVDACVMDTDKASHHINFTIYSEGTETVVIEISDDGIGMDEETRQKIFTLFFSSKGSRGTGLGLFISHHIIRQHGGSVEVASEYGNGTTLKIRMPRQRAVHSNIDDPPVNYVESLPK